MAAVSATKTSGVSLCSPPPAGGGLLHRESEQRWRSDPTRLLSGSEMPQGEHHTPHKPSTNTHMLTEIHIPAPSSMCVCACVCQATESVDHIADLWRSADEDLRSAARETVLSFGTNMNYFSFISIVLRRVISNSLYSPSVPLQVKRATWPSRGWTSCTRRCRRRRTRTKRLRLPFYRKQVWTWNRSVFVMDPSWRVSVILTV